jgi:small subunit ribosomal protein S6
MYQRKYELFFLVDPDLSDSDLKALETRLREIMAREGGTVLSYNSWGKKKLAYPVKKRTRGHYFLMEFAGGPHITQELERNLRIDERVLKFITVKLEDRYVPGKEEPQQAPQASDEQRKEAQETTESSETSDESEE